MGVPAFIPGLSLAADTYHEAVRPILDATHPGLVHSAALLGPGSEVLGFDTPARPTTTGDPGCCCSSGPPTPTGTPRT